MNQVTGTKSPPYHGLPAFAVISLMAVLFFFLLSLNLWRCVCSVCLAPPIVKFLFVNSANHSRRLIVSNDADAEIEKSLIVEREKKNDREQPLLLPTVVK